VSATEICVVLQVYDRSFAVRPPSCACTEQLAMAPAAYDRLRRNSLVRATLRRPDPASERVWAIARTV